MHPITKFRGREKLTRVAMSRKIKEATGRNVGHRTIQQWENGTNFPSFTNLWTLSVAFGKELAFQTLDWGLDCLDRGDGA